MTPRQHLQYLLDDEVFIETLVDLTFLEESLAEECDAKSYLREAIKDAKKASMVSLQEKRLERMKEWDY